MEISNLQLTPEQRQALLEHPGEPVHIQDAQTKRVYLLFEAGTCPELEEAYIRDGLELARDQIARGEISEATLEEVIAKAKGCQTTSS
jgi:hypothetical protein